MSLPGRLIVLSGLILVFVSLVSAQTEHSVFVNGGEPVPHRIVQPVPFPAKVDPRGGLGVRIRLVIGPEGGVESAAAIGVNAEVAALAEYAAKQMRFTPFERDGKPVRVIAEDFLPVYLPEDWLSPRVRFPSIKNFSSLRVKLERSSCYGYCPEYSVEIRGNGAIRYEGRSGMLFIAGHHRDRISRESVTRLVDEFRRADFFSLKDQYNSGNPDSPSFKLSLKFDNVSKTVIDHDGGLLGRPPIAADLERFIDKEAQTEKWLKGTAGTIPSLLREHWHFRANSRDNYQLFRVAAVRDDFLKLYLDHGFPPVNTASIADCPLVIAAPFRDPSFLERLLEKSGNPSRSRLSAALSAAASTANLPAMRFLIGRGADVNRPARNKGFEPPLISAIQSGKLAAVEEILHHHPDIRVTSLRGKDVISAMFDDSSLDQPENISILRALIGAGADVNARDPEDLETPIFHADSASNAVDLLRVLVAAGSDLNARDRHGRTALIAGFDLEYAEALIALGADVFARDKFGKTAIDEKVELGGSPELVALFKRVMALKQNKP